MVTIADQMLEEGNRICALEAKLKPAYSRNVKHCVRCGFCCHKRSCVLTPDEVDKVAKHLMLPVKSLIQKLFIIDIEEDIYFLRPVGKNIKDLRGKYVPSNRTYDEGPCVFLKDIGCGEYDCELQAVKPRQARSFKCWAMNRIFNPIPLWKGDVLWKRFGITKKEAGI